MASRYNKPPDRNSEQEFDRQAIVAPRLSRRAIDYILEQTLDDITIARLTYELEQRSGRD